MKGGVGVLKVKPDRCLSINDAPAFPWQSVDILLSEACDTGKQPLPGSMQGKMKGGAGDLNVKTDRSSSINGVPAFPWQSGDILLSEACDTSKQPFPGSVHCRVEWKEASASLMWKQIGPCPWMVFQRLSNNPLISQFPRPMTQASSPVHCRAEWKEASVSLMWKQIDPRT